LGFSSNGTCHPLHTHAVRRGVLWHHVVVHAPQQIAWAVWVQAPQRHRWDPCGCTHGSHGARTYHLSMQHACASAEGPRTTSGAVQSNRMNGASATPLGPVWVYARYPTTMHRSSIDAACVYECGGPTHDERRRAIESYEWCLWGLCGCTHATQRPCICHLSMQHACTSAEGPRTTSGAVQSNRTNGASATLKVAPISRARSLHGTASTCGYRVDSSACVRLCWRVWVSQREETRLHALCLGFGFRHSTAGWGRS